MRMHRLLEVPGLAVDDVRCDGGASGWSAGEPCDDFALVLVRSGCFRRRVDGRDSVLDPAALYVQAPGEEQQFAHPHAGGDTCTVLRVGGELPAGGEPLYSPPSLDLEHRLLLAALRRDEFEASERAFRLVESVLGRSRRARVNRNLVDEAREAISVDLRLGHAELARRLCVSPSHLSRAFRTQTGETLSRYRNRVRVRLALERLAAGERSLSRLAVDLGFADHAHLTRAVRAEHGAPPSQLRALLN
jgi:AraC-like DNA-binding protein